MLLLWYLVKINNLVFVGLVPIFVLSVQYTLDKYRSICSTIKCPLEITVDDYFVTSNCVVYDAIKAAYIVLRIIGY